MMRRILWLACLAGALVIMFGIAGAVRNPIVARYRIPIDGLQRPVRIVQLSDVHASAMDMPRERLRRVVARINALQPDIIVLTGDYISGNPEAWSLAETRAALAPLGELTAPLGVFAVLGNHDGPAKTMAAFAGTGVRVLRGTSAAAGPIWIVGADDLLRGSPAVEAMRRAAEVLPAGRPIIVIAHEPDFFQYLPERATLLIAGHTHGGQIRLPIVGGPRIGEFIDAHLRGVFREHGQWLVVSSGLGTSLVPIRIGVPPEIVEISLIPYSAGRKSGTER